jgi:hypothetical protein
MIRPSLSAVARLARFSDVRQERYFAGALYGASDLRLVTTAAAGVTATTQLAALADESTQRLDVFVVDVVDFVLAEGA